MKDWQRYYMLLGELIASYPPDLARTRPGQTELMWLGRAHGLVEAVGNTLDAIGMKSLITRLDQEIYRPGAAQEIQATVYRAFATAELNAPETLAGAFVPVGARFEAFAAIGKLVQTAVSKVLIVDPYMDEKALTDFAVLASEGVLVQLLADSADHKASLKPATLAWNAQYGQKRPLDARLAPARSRHDRLIIVDDKMAWTLTQSLNHFAGRAPAAILKFDGETAALKVAAYTSIWSSAAVL